MEESGGVMDDFVNFVGFFFLNNSNISGQKKPYLYSSVGEGSGDDFIGREGPSEFYHSSRGAEEFC